MNKNDIYIVGEDPVTLSIVRRIVTTYAPNLNIVRAMPARGGQMKSMIKNFNLLSLKRPVVLLADMDTNDCAPLAKRELINGLSQNENFLVNIAVDEAEAWLYADREGFAKYLKVDPNQIPVAEESTFGGPHKRIEVNSPCKTSYHLTHELILHSEDSVLKKQIEATGRCKGKEYNEAVLPFIDNNWNIEEARKHSYSLDGMIKRIEMLEKRYII